MSMNVSLPASLEAFVQEKVAQGEYESASEVMREAIRLLKRREELWKAEMQKRIAEGMSSLREGRLIPAEEVWAELEQAVLAAEKDCGSIGG